MALHKLWGWGPEGERGFDDTTRPRAWPFIVGRLGIPETADLRPVTSVDLGRMPASRCPADLIAALGAAVGTEHVLVDDRSRAARCYGKSFTDLWRARRGEFVAPPDVIVLPRSTGEVETVLTIARAHGAAVIPFGGGTNICGALNAEGAGHRPVVSLDTTRLDSVFDIDVASGIARVGAGILGPDLEDALAHKGLTLGHFPDSFLYSTVGGWIATRSSGMQSDRYGNIEDMVLGVTVVTPGGTFATRALPRRSAGPELRELLMGSEGVFGVITEATLRVRRRPAARVVRGFLFPNFESGIEAQRRIVQAGLQPTMFRLNDADKTALTFAFKERASPAKERVAHLMKAAIATFTRIDFSTACLAIAGAEGERTDIARQTRAMRRIYGACGAVDIGTGLNAGFEKSKFEYPHLRDYVMDRGCVADVSETSTAWSNILPLYGLVRERALEAAQRQGVTILLACHLSHSYDTGASLYFTFGFHDPSDGALDRYVELKTTIQQAFMDGGGTLSHHHGVGTEHRPWFAQEKHPDELAILAAVKDTLDADGIMNPGKLLLDRGAGRDGSGAPSRAGKPRNLVAAQ